MAKDIITIWNQAVSACGNKAIISDPEANDKATNLCRLWYPLIRGKVIKAGDWPSAKTYTALALKATRDDTKQWRDSDPAPGWKYAYSEPADMLAPRHLHSYGKFDRAWLTDTNTIVTNESQPILHYMFDQTDVTKWDTDLENAVVMALAHSICMQLTGTRSLTESLQERATEAILVGQTNTANETHMQRQAEVSWFQDRGYSDHQSPTRYIWPYDTYNPVAA